MLERNVEVFADFRLRDHCFDHFVGKGRRIGVVEPNPCNAVNAAQPVEQFAQPSFAVKVDPVVGRVLCDDDQLLDPCGGQFAGLLLQLLHRHRYMAAADERDGAIAAHPVAALRNFQIGIVARGGQMPFGRQCGVLRGTQRPDDAVPVAGAEIVVDLRNFGAQVIGITFRQTADNEQPFDFSGLLGRCRPQDHLDGLLFGIADESAGIDYHDCGVRAVAVEVHLVTGGCQTGHEVFAVDRVFRAAEGDDVNFFHGRTGHRQIHGGRSGASRRPPRRCRYSAPECGTGR